jgi:hypothetical protein
MWHSQTGEHISAGWISALAGMTATQIRQERVIPAKAGIQLFTRGFEAKEQRGTSEWK